MSSKEKKQKKKSMGLKLKLVFIIIPIVFILIGSFFALARNVVIKSSKETLQAKSEVYTKEINSWTTQILSELQVYKDTIEEAGFANDDEILKYLETSYEKNMSYPYGLYMGDNTGVYLDGSGWVPGDDWVLVERDWYVDGKDNDSLAFGEPYYDSMTGQVCVSASVRMNYSKATRVLASDVYLDAVASKISEILDKEEDAFLVTKGSQTIIAHLDQEMMAKTLGECEDSLYTSISKAIEEDKNGMLTVKGKDGTYIACLYPVEHTDWYLVTYVKEKMVLANLYEMEIVMAAIAAVATIVLIFVIFRMMNGVVKPVRKMTGVIKKISEGDFTQNVEVKGNDEIAMMSSDLQLFISNMKGTIKEIHQIAGRLQEQSLENGEISEVLKNSSSNQEEEMEGLNRMVEQLSKAAEEATAQMVNLSEIIHLVDSESQHTEMLMKESVAISKNGKKDMEQVNSGMDSIHSSIVILSEQIEKVGNSVLQIGSMVEKIIDIASETNLLALSAAIEATRAGEAGMGFATVAGQIGKLAENSGATADEISKLTIEIKGTVEQALLHMVTNVSKVKENVGVVSRASNTYEDLYEKVEETNSKVKQLTELVNKVGMVFDEMGKISQNQLRATEQIAQSVDGMNEQTNAVAINSLAVAEEAEKLQVESKNLMGHIGKFQVE